MKRLLQLLFFSCTILLFFYRASYKNWDMIGYMGTVLEMKFQDVKKAHDETYRMLKEDMSEADYWRLTKRSDYRKSMTTDYEAFGENLSFYRIRIFYIALIRLFYECGFPLWYATVLPSTLSIIAIIFLVFYFLKRESGDVYLAVTLSSILLVLPQTIYLGKSSHPDALSALLLLLLALSYLSKQKKLIIFLLMVISILTRTDNIIWVNILLILDVVSMHPINKLKENLVAVLILTTLYITINTLSQNAGWWVVFYHTFVDRINYPLSNPPVFDFTVYLSQFSMEKTRSFWPYLVGIATFIYMYKRAILSLKMTRGMVIILTCIFTFLIKFMLFPVLWSRLHFILFLITCVMVIIERRELLNVQPCK